MLDSLAKLQRLLTRQDSLQFALLLVAIVVSAIVEVVGIAAVLPFMQLVAQPDRLQGNEFLSWLFETVGFSSQRAMLTWMGVFVMVLFVLSRILSAFTFWLIHKSIWSTAHRITTRLLHAYLRQPYGLLLVRNSAEMLRKAVVDVNGLVTGILLAGSQFIAQIVLASGIFALLFVVRPKLALAALAIFGGTYVVLHLSRAAYVTRLGRERLRADRQRFTSFSEALTGMKVIRTEGVAPFFLNRFEKASYRYSQIHPRFQVVAIVPRYIVEVLAFGGVLVIVIVMLATQRELLDTIPTLSVFALAGYRLLPALQKAFMGAAQLSHNLPVIEQVYEDMQQVAESEPPVTARDGGSISFSDEIELRGVGYRYTSADLPVINDVDLKIAKNARIALVGATGSGKSTLMDLIVGLLLPRGGQLLVDGVPLTLANIAAWRRRTAYVPQDVFLYDDTVARNIAFGIEDDQVDFDRVRDAAEIAQADGFITTELPDAYDTVVGERGVRLSGGQRQRIGLARAFYRRPDVLLLDEATSALDGITEARVMSALYDRLPDVTVVMVAHRLSTVRLCDRIYLLADGRIADEGSHEELLASSETFRQMVELTS